MQTAPPEYIAVILDQSFGEELFRIAQSVHVWLTPSPANRAAAESLRGRGAQGFAKMVTVWSSPRTGATTDEWLSILEDIELHHGEWSGPGVAGIDVYGATASPPVRAALRAAGYEIVAIRPNGFRASKSVPSN